MLTHCPCDSIPQARGGRRRLESSSLHNRLISGDRICLDRSNRDVSISRVSLFGANSGSRLARSDASCGDQTDAIPIASHWRWTAVPLVCFFAAIIAVFWQTVWSILNTWYSSRTFSHGFLIPPLVLYLAWIRRGRVAALEAKPNYWVFPLLMIPSFVWLLGNLGDVRILQQFALVSILVGTVWAVLGTAVARALWFPLAFLFFAVPFGESLIGPLQDFTARFAVAALRLSNVPVVLENRTIAVPSGPWVVAEACSGIRYLISSLVLGLIYASLVYKSRSRRILFVVASIVVPIVANGIRAYGIVLLGYLTDNKLAAGVDHIIYGWVFFTAVQLLLFSIGFKWREPTSAEIENTRLSHPLQIVANQDAYSAKAATIAAMCAFILVASAPVVAARLWSRHTATEPAGGQPTVVVSAPWQPVPAYDTSWTPALQHVDSSSSQSYVSAGHRVDVYLARYSEGHPVELVSGYNLVSSPKTWQEVGRGVRNATIDGKNTSVLWNLIQSGFASRMVWICYWVAGQYTANPTKVKFLEAKARLLGQPANVAVIVLAADYEPGGWDSGSDIQDFLSHTLLSAAVQPDVK